MHSTRHSFLWILVMIFVMFLAACGRKGDLQSPQLETVKEVKKVQSCPESPVRQRVGFFGHKQKKEDKVIKSRAFQYRSDSRYDQQASVFSDNLGVAMHSLKPETVIKSRSDKSTFRNF